MPTRTLKPELTVPRARLLTALARYIDVALAHGMAVEPKISLVEVHKIAYLLQSGGADLGLAFDKGHMGPYSPRLHRGLANMEGHYILGFGDGTGGARADLRLLPGTAEAAEAAVSGDDEFEKAWLRLADTTLGYEYPEGMELLASVHYVAAGRPAESSVLAERLQAWSSRKARLFTTRHVEGAHLRLTANHMLPAG